MSLPLAFVGILLLFAAVVWPALYYQAATWYRLPVERYRKSFVLVTLAGLAAILVQCISVLSVDSGGIAPYVPGLPFTVILVSTASLWWSVGMGGRRAAIAGVLYATAGGVLALGLSLGLRACFFAPFQTPTGGMAPTILGYHKNVLCPECKFFYEVSASSEYGVAPHEARSAQVIMCTCPVCGFVADVDPEKSPNAAAYRGGDCFFVDKRKVLLQGGPERWDAVVFRYPEDPNFNYIKRLVGLPGETVKISHGDLFTKANENDGFKIQRKPPVNIQSMLQIVHDSDHVAASLAQRGWPLRWQPAEKAVSKWKVADDGRAFEIQPGESTDWLRYNHLVPTAQDWDFVDADSSPTEPPRPQLIRDSYAYNTAVLRSRGFDPQTLGLHWVGDLSLEVEVEVKNSTGRILLDLVEGGRHYTCSINVSNGETQLSAIEFANRQPRAKTAVNGPGSYRLQFANIDNQLLLWINGSLVTFDKPTTYASEISYPAPADLAPAGIGCEGTPLRASHIKLSRDIYYIADRSSVEPRRAIGITDYNAESQIPQMDPIQLVEFFSSPDQWHSLRPGGGNQQREVEFPLRWGKDPGQDQYFVLGDNSPFSKDARLWEQVHYVPRQLLIGTASSIYWPPSRWGNLNP